jgi:hypothetical protein
VPVKSFEEVQRLLADALRANRPGSGVEHVLIALPSYSLGESLLSHYADRIPALEHRYLVSLTLLKRIEGCHLVFVASRDPGPAVVDYYASLLGTEGRTLVRERFHVLEVPDLSGRSVAAKLLDRPDLVEDLHQLVAGRPALIEPWNVTESEVAVSRRLGVPINGTSPRLWTLGFKSEGRRMFREAGVLVPAGVEDVRTVADVAHAVDTLRAARPQISGVVVKLDDSGAGDGNVVLDVEQPGLSARLVELPDWYVRDLAAGGIVEERVTGARFASPSAQIDVLPGGEVVVLATHEQVLGGSGGQVYLGCRFPADPAYAAILARHARAAGEVLAARGVVGRASIDFAVVQHRTGEWAVYALEVNLRKGGTTHPYAVLRNLVPGRYDADRACWFAEDGTTRAYSATDNLIDPAWTALSTTQAIEAVERAGLAFDPHRGTGVVLHMLAGLAIDGRLGLTAIGRDRDEAVALHAATAPALGRAAADSTTGSVGRRG